MPTKMQRVISDAYLDYLGLLNSNPHRYRAAQANKPTPPKKKWKWSYANNG